MCGLLKIPSLSYPRTEADERIYWQLAESLVERHEYTLQGTELLKSLSPHVYDRPLFHHPPLFAALLVPFVLTGAKGAAVLVSWLGHFFVVIAVGLIGRHALRHSADARVTSPVFWLPLLGVSADPLLMFVSRRIWIDSLLAGLVALAVATLLVADGERRRITLALAGLVLGLAALAKLTALMLVPVFLFAALRGDATWKQRALSTLAIVVPVAALVVPWMVLFYIECGVFVPSWVKPDARLMQLFPFVRAAVERPWYYYIVKLALIMPLALVAFWLIVGDRTVWRNRAVQVVIAWFAVVLVTLTFMGIDGYGFQMRHIAPAVPAVYAIALLTLLERERPGLLMVCAFAMLVGTVTGAMYLLVPEFDEMLSLWRFGGFGSY